MPIKLLLGELNALVAAGLKSGKVKSLPVTVFARNEVEEAFRYLASGLQASPIHELCPYLESPCFGDDPRMIVSTPWNPTCEVHPSRHAFTVSIL